MDAYVCAQKNKRKKKILPGHPPDGTNKQTNKNKKTLGTCS